MWVYVHTCPNGKRYVGQTVKEPKKRWENGSGYKSQKVFFRAISKYGWNNINHYLFEVASKAEMDYLEKYLIYFYNTTDNKYGYNVTKGGEGVTGFKHSDESKAKMSAAKVGKEPWNKGQKTSDEAKEKISKAKLGKPNKALQVSIIGTNSNGEDFVFGSLTEASNSLHIIHQNISKCLKGERNTAGGYKWRYA